MTATEEATTLALAAAQAAADKLATDIVLIDVSDRLAITDVFVVVTGNNERQVEAIVDAVEEQLRVGGSKPIRREGHRDGRWVLLDYGDIVVHVQHSEERVFYALERLWKDCPFIPFVDAAIPIGGALPGAPGEPVAPEPVVLEPAEAEPVENAVVEADSVENAQVEDAQVEDAAAETRR